MIDVRTSEHVPYNGNRFLSLNIKPISIVLTDFVFLLFCNFELIQFLIMSIYSWKKQEHCYGYKKKRGIQIMFINCSHCMDKSHISCSSQCYKYTALQHILVLHYAVVYFFFRILRELGLIWILHTVYSMETFQWALYFPLL